MIKSNDLAQFNPKLDTLYPIAVTRYLRCNNFRSIVSTSVKIGFSCSLLVYHFFRLR